MADPTILHSIARLVPPGSRVLDLGCGDGALLAHLQATRDCSGYGVEIDDAEVQACIRRGVNVLQLNLEEGLTMFGDNAFDVVLQIDTLHLDSVQVNDTREPTPTQPLTELVLPLPMNLTWSVDRLRIEGRQTLALDGARGHYRYGPADTADRSAWKEWGSDHAAVRDAHHLRIDHLALALDTDQQAEADHDRHHRRTAAGNQRDDFGEAESGCGSEARRKDHAGGHHGARVFQRRPARGDEAGGGTRRAGGGADPHQCRADLPSEHQGRP